MKPKYMRLLRPIAWITFLFPFSIGFGLGVTSESNLFHVVFAFIAFTAWMSFCFVLNALADKDVDKFHNGRSKDMNLAYQPLVTGEITEKEVLYLSMVFLFSSLLFAWLTGLLFFLLILIVDVLGYLYSMPPMRLKTKPVTDILCNALAAGIIFAAGLSIGGTNISVVMISGAFIVACVFYIPTVVTDYEFDKKAGLVTSAVFFGSKKLLQAMYPLTAVATLIWLTIFLTSGLELRVLALLVIIYTIVFTVVSNIKLKEKAHVGE